MKVTKVRNCNLCHECGTPLEKWDRGGDEEYCKQCDELKYYRAHGWAGSGGDPEYCPYVDVEFTNQGHELVTARADVGGKRVLWERRQTILPLTV